MAEPDSSQPYHTDHTITIPLRRRFNNLYGFSISDEDGAPIIDKLNYSKTRRSGLRRGARVAAVNGRRVRSVADCLSAVHASGDRMSITIIPPTHP